MNDVDSVPIVVSDVNVGDRLQETVNVLFPSLTAAAKQGGVDASVLYRAIRNDLRVTTLLKIAAGWGIPAYALFMPPEMATPYLEAAKLRKKILQKNNNSIDTPDL